MENSKKVCIECKELKEPEEFYSPNWCKDCRRKYAREYIKKRRKDPEYKKKSDEWAANWRINNKEKYLETAKNRLRRMKENIINHYGKACACCGESRYEFLSIDHINKDGAKQRRENPKKGAEFYKWIIDSGYPKDLRILCYNCNSSLGYFGYCPHGTLIQG